MKMLNDKNEHHEQEKNMTNFVRITNIYDKYRSQSIENSLPVSVTYSIGTKTSSSCPQEIPNNKIVSNSILYFINYQSTYFV